MRCAIHYWTGRSEHFGTHCYDCCPVSIFERKHFVSSNSIFTVHIKNNFIAFRTARAIQNEQLEKLFGTIEFSDRPMLEVRLPTAEPEAFEMILSYIYTDKIDCK